VRNRRRVRTVIGEPTAARADRRARVQSTARADRRARVQSTADIVERFPTGSAGEKGKRRVPRTFDNHRRLVVRIYSPLLSTAPRFPRDDLSAPPAENDELVWRRRALVILDRPTRIVRHTVFRTQDRDAIRAHFRQRKSYLERGAFNTYNDRLRRNAHGFFHSRPIFAANVYVLVHAEKITRARARFGQRSSRNTLRFHDYRETRPGGHVG